MPLTTLYSETRSVTLELHDAPSVKNPFNTVVIAPRMITIRAVRRAGARWLFSSGTIAGVRLRKCGTPGVSTSDIGLSSEARRDNPWAQAIVDAEIARLNRQLDLVTPGHDESDYAAQIMGAQG